MDMEFFDAIDETLEEIEKNLDKAIGRASCPCQGCVYDRALRRIDLRAFPIKITVRAESATKRRGFAYASMEVKDRFDGSDTRLTTGMPVIASGDATTEDEVIAAVRQAVENMLLHELDECWRVDGKLVRDPHVGTVASCRECLTVFHPDDPVERHRHGHR